MTKLCILLAFSLPLAAQVTVTKTQTTVTATTGTTVCTATSVLPNVSLKCVNGSDIWSSSGPVTVGTSGITYQMNSSGGAITWLFSLPTAAGPINDQVTATPTAGCPAAPAVCTSSGTF